MSALTPSTALVSFDAIGYWSVDKLRLLYTDESAIIWTRLDKLETFQSGKTYYLAKNLAPNQRYFFMAKARVDMKARQTVTHILMPPSGERSEFTVQSSIYILAVRNFEIRIVRSGVLIFHNSIQRKPVTTRFVSL